MNSELDKLLADFFVSENDKPKSMENLYWFIKKCIEYGFRLGRESKELAIVPSWYYNVPPTLSKQFESYMKRAAEILYDDKDDMGMWCWFKKKDRLEEMFNELDKKRLLGDEDE